MKKERKAAIPLGKSVPKIICIMKLVSLFLLVGFVEVSANIYSQTANISLDLKSASLKEVIKEIQTQTEFTFFYSPDDIESVRVSSIDVNKASLEKTLDLCLKGTGLKYEIVHKAVILKREEKPTTVLPWELNTVAQQQKISGRVTDSSGASLPGVSVVVKGTTIGNITDANGNYSITDVPDDAILLFSFVGMKTQEVSVSGKANLNVVMTEETVGLDEVVAIGYGTQKRESLTGAIATVKSKDLVKSSVSNPSQLLAGRLPGLITKQTSGEPGYDNAALSIRGFGNALVIVDGFETSMNNLDPNEIESISILKDASAAIYGARAGNGVILITTKRGKISTPTIEFNSNYSLQGLTAFPKAASAAQYVELYHEAQVNTGTPESSMRFSEEDVLKWKEGKEKGYISKTNWWDVTMNYYAPMQQHNLTLSGGSSDIKYQVFMGYTGQDGMYKSGDNKMNRYNIRTNVDGQINRNLSAEFDMSVIISDLNSPSWLQEQLWKSYYEMQPIYSSSLPDPNKIPYGGSVINIISAANRKYGGYNDQDNNQISSTLNLKYSIPWIKGLSVKGAMNYLYTGTEAKNWKKAFTMYTYDEESGYYSTYNGSDVTSLNQNFSKYRKITGQIYLNYDRIFKDDHSVSLLLLSEFYDVKSTWMSAGRGRFITEAIDYLFAGGADSQFSDGSASESGRISYVGRGNYSYKAKYLAEATFRYDGSPNFPADKRWGFFPSLSLGWRISEEAFIKNHIPQIDNLKLRVSYSKTGYDAIGAFQYLTGYKYASWDGKYVVDHEVRTGLMSKGLANPDITWEKMTNYNIGFDFSLYKSKLYGEFDCFYRDRQGILATRLLSLPNTFGATLPDENINSMNNRGFELVLGHKGNILNNFLYDISGNISWTRAKWEHYEEPEYTDADGVRINKLSGNWVNRTFGYKTDGLFTSQTEIDNYELDQDKQGNATILPGDVKYIDLNNDHVLDWRDKTEIGRGSTPEIMFGLSANLQYKNFDLSLLFQGATLCDVMVVPDLMVSPRNVPEMVYALRWTEENNNKWGEIPRLYMGGKPNNTYASDYWLQNGSYVRLKALNIGYNFSSSFLRKIAFSNMRIYLAGTNLLTFSRLRKFDIDPESVSGNGWNYPQQKVFTLGINLKF